MRGTIKDYFTPDLFHAVYIPERSRENDSFYRLLTEYGHGEVRKIDFNDFFMILIADFTPAVTFERITDIQCDYIEISQFETDTSSYKVGGRRMKRVEQGICCFANTSKTSYAYCEAGKPVRFVKILIGKDYFDSFLKVRYGDSYDHSRNAMDYLSRNPNLPELNYIFRQIKDCRAIGTARQIYLESKVMEILSFVTHHYQEGQNKSIFPSNWIDGTFTFFFFGK